MLDRRAVARDQRRPTAGRDDVDRPVRPPFGFHLLGDPGHEPADEVGVAEVDSRPHALDSRGSDRLLRPRNVDARQSRRPPRQGVGSDTDARGDGATEVSAIGVDGVARRCRAEVNDDRRDAVELSRRHGVHDPVGSDVARRLVEDRHVFDELRRHEERLDAEVLSAESREGSFERRHDRRDHDPFDRARVDALQVEERAGEDAELVDRARPVGGETPVGAKLFAVENPHQDLGIADVEGEEHGSIGLRNRSATGRLYSGVGSLHRRGHRCQRG